MDTINFIYTKESQCIEYKTRWTPLIANVICAFMNTIGGKIVIGVQEGKEQNIIIGINNPDELVERTRILVNHTLTSNNKETVESKVSYIIDDSFNKYLLIIVVEKATQPVFCHNKLYLRTNQASNVEVKSEQELYDVKNIMNGVLSPIRHYIHEDEITNRNTRKILQIGNLPTGAYVYKYMDLESALLSLCGKRGCAVKQTLRFVEPTFWTDQYEGRFYTADYTKVAHSKSEYPFLYACCVTTSSEDESAWNIYSYNAKGLKARCVQFKLNRKKLVEQLAEKCPKDSSLFFGVVTYRQKSEIDNLHLKDIRVDGVTKVNEDYNSFFNNFNLEKYIRLLLIKRIAYEHEKEFRLFIVPTDAYKHLKTISKDKCQSKPLFVELKWLEILECVTIDKNCSEYEKALLQESIDKLIESEENNYDSNVIEEIRKKLAVRSFNVYDDEERNGKQLRVGLSADELMDMK